MNFNYQFKISFAGINTEIRCRYGQIKELCGDYLTASGRTDITVGIGAEELDAAVNESPDFPPWYTEFSLLYRDIMRSVPYYGVFAIHGAAITCGERAYIFTAPSGTGKSTHIRQWKKYLGDKVDIINGDKPVVLIGEKEAFICSTPWSGKEGWHKNRCAVLGGVCILKRGKENSIKTVEPGAVLDELISQIFIPVGDATAALLSLELFDRMCGLAPFYQLSCDISEQAVKTAYSALTGKEYPKFFRNPF